VWDGDQKPILSNHTKENDTLQLNTEYGYHDVNQGPLRWRTFTLFSPQDDRFIQVAQRHDIRSELVHEIVLSTTLPFMIVLPLLLITLGIAIKRSFRPLNRLSNEIRSYVPQHLNPIDPARVPLEALSLVEALNTLMHRVSSTLARERAFTANAAHELRTPLTAIRLHAQNLHNQIVSQQGISLETTNSIVASVDRMTHVVHQLLTLAQTSSNLPPSQHPIAISTLIERVVRHLTPLAEEKNQTVRVHAPDVPPIYLHEMMLETLLMNLLDNAIRYTPTQGHIKVSATWQQERLTLIVEDNGPGIPDAEKQKVTQRFYRVRGTTAPGSGLGLAIVGDIIEELHGTLNFENAQANGCGLQVVLTIPASATPPTPGRPAF
ncbi:MAG: ATP-binding protein, partial [Gammaproteobacteria bacterium]